VKRKWCNGIFVAGGAALVYGLWLAWAPLGWMFGGGVFVLWAILEERKARHAERTDGRG